MPKKSSLCWEAAPLGRLGGRTPRDRGAQALRTSGLQPGVHGVNPGRLLETHERPRLRSSRAQRLPEPSQQEAWPAPVPWVWEGDPAQEGWSP